MSDKSAALWLFDSPPTSLVVDWQIFAFHHHRHRQTPTTTDRTCGGQRSPMTMWFSGKCLRGTVRKNNLRARREAINYLSVSVDERRPETGNGNAKCSASVRHLRLRRRAKFIHLFACARQGVNEGRILFFRQLENFKCTRCCGCCRYGYTPVLKLVEALILFTNSVVRSADLDMFL